MTRVSGALELRPNQVQALADLTRAFAVHDRAQLVSPCGSGKTITSASYAAASEAGRVLVLVPSLALLAQTLREWRRVPGWSFDALVVCSDPTTSAGVAERAEDSDPGAGPHDAVDFTSQRARVTTDPAEVDRFWHRSSAGRSQVVFSTYHSAPVVAAAQARRGYAFDLAVCDEAHRLAGHPRREFLTALDPRQIVARRRLFMTATPRMSGPDGYSMSEPRLFGPVAHDVSFGEAIRVGLLCDYQVLVIGIRGHTRAGPEGAPDADPLALTPAALLEAVDGHGVSRVLSFHGRVAKAEAFARSVGGVQTPGGRQIDARHVSGSMPMSQRTAALAWLAAPGAEGEVRVLSNARVLSEGVDVPAVDAVLFADPRSSSTETLQALGRVMRRSPGKRLGSIVVPVVLSEGGDDDTELLLSRFSVLWSVLRALRAHDQRFADDVDAATRAQVRHGSDGAYRPARLKFVLPHDVEDLVQLRLVQEVGDAWEQHYAGCQAWAFRHAGRRLIRTAQWQELRIGDWALKQRTAHARGVLPAERARRLEELPEWFWDRADAAWDDSHAILSAFADAYGSVAENETGPSVFAGLRAAAPQREQLGVWVARQRQAYRDGLLDPARADLLEALPGWTWQPVSADDLAHVDALKTYVEFEKRAVVPDGHVEDGLALGRWVWNVRRRKYTGRLHPALEDEIWAATPSRWAGGPRTRWQWETAELQWRLSFTALRQYAQREGHAAPPARQREELSDLTVRLGQWVALQRHQHRRGELAASRTAALERLPGWAWDGDVGGTRPVEEPLELPAGLEHGGAGAIARGCHCQTCLDARRTRQVGYRAARRASEQAHGVDPGKARRHLVRLEQQIDDGMPDDGGRRRPGFGRPLIAATAGVPLGVVRQILAGTVQGITNEHEARLLGTTVAACLSNTVATGSRGRLLQRGSARVDATPTRALADDLQARGFDLNWIGRELGYAARLQMCGDTITQRLADQVAQLHRSVGDLVAPATPRTRRVPPLSELQQREAA